MRKNKLSILLLFCGFLFSCATTSSDINPTEDTDYMSVEEEIKFGHFVDASIMNDYMKVDDPGINGAVTTIGQQLVHNSDRSDLDFTFKVLSTPRVNAFAGPGGYVYVTTGLLDLLESKDELAAVLAHEIGHITARHQVRAFHNAQRAQIGIALIDIAGIFLAGIPAGSIGSSLAGDLAKAVGYMATMVVYQGYSRAYEEQADRLGVRYSFRSGFNHRASISVFEKFIKIEEEQKQGQSNLDLTILRSHPKLKERIRTIEQIADEVEATETVY
jgi:predicted Zn-dependent protease